MTLDEFMLALVVWREARGEPTEGQIAVAHVIKTRVRNPRWWGSDYYTVITKPFQFSSMTDPHDPQTASFPKLNDPEFQKALTIAKDVLEDRAPNPVPTSDHYFADYIASPAWAAKGKFLKQIGHHKFYTMENVT